MTYQRETHTPGARERRRLKQAYEHVIVGSRISHNKHSTMFYPGSDDEDEAELLHGETEKKDTNYFDDEEDDGLANSLNKGRFFLGKSMPWENHQYATTTEKRNAIRRHIMSTRFQIHSDPEDLWKEKEAAVLQLIGRESPFEDELFEPHDDYVVHLDWFNKWYNQERDRLKGTFGSPTPTITGEALLMFEDLLRDEELTYELTPQRRMAMIIPALVTDSPELAQLLVCSGFVPITPHLAFILMGGGMKLDVAIANCVNDEGTDAKPIATIAKNEIYTDTGVTIDGLTWWMENNRLLNRRNISRWFVSCMTKQHLETVHPPKTEFDSLLIRVYRTWWNSDDMTNALIVEHRFPIKEADRRFRFNSTLFMSTEFANFHEEFAIHRFWSWWTRRPAITSLIAYMLTFDFIREEAIKEAQAKAFEGDFETQAVYRELLFYANDVGRREHGSLHI